MPLLDVLTDDQLAVIGCLGALAVAFGIMSLTWTVRTSMASRTTKDLQPVPVRPSSYETTVIADRKAA